MFANITIQLQTSAVKKLLEWNDGDEDDFPDMHALLLRKCKMAGCGNILDFIALSAGHAPTGC